MRMAVKPADRTTTHNGALQPGDTCRVLMEASEVMEHEPVNPLAEGILDSGLFDCKPNARREPVRISANIQR
jgi:hypothetical protein